MYKIQSRTQTPPNEVFDGLLAGCLVVGLLAGVIFGFKLYNSILSR